MPTMARDSGLTFHKSGAPIPTSTVHRILRNRIYTGDFHWHGRLDEIAIGGRVA